MAKTENNNNNATNTIEQDNGFDKLPKDNNISDDIIKSKKYNNNNNNSNNIDNIYIDPSLQNNNDSDNHSIPTFPQVPHHAPPEDSSELTSPWWSAEQADIPENNENNDNNNMDNNNNNNNNDNNNSNNNDSNNDNSNKNSNDNNIHHVYNNHQHENKFQNEELSHFLVSFSRQATERKNGDMVWREDCFIWTKEPKQQKESNLVDEIKDAAITYSQQQQQSSLSPFPSSIATSDDHQHHSNNNMKKSFPLNSQCTMVCLFRESQQRKLKKLKETNMSNTWNPFYGNWLVVTKTRSAFTEHIAENDILKKNSPDYYTVELGEKFGRIGEDVTKFFAKTFTPMQELGRRYIESWNDGTQNRFFNKFFESAKRGDAFLLVRDSARRMIENMMNTDEKKKDDDHKR